MHAINRIALVLGLLFVMAGVGSHRAAANTPFVINSTVDEPDALSGNGQCASQPSGVCTLRAAIMEANAARIRVLLRPDQQQRFDQHLTQLRQRFEAFRQGAPAAPPTTAPAPSGI